jgi:phosphatidylinositol alpha-1,6-mannosyltransferase
VKAVTLFSYDYPPNDGGISRLCAAIAEEVTRRGHDVSVVTLGPGGAAGAARPQVPTAELPRRRWVREAAAWLWILRRNPDTPLLSSLWYPEGTLAWLAGCTDAFVMAHGNEVMRYPPGWRGLIKSRIRRRVLSAARAVICNSRYTERLVRSISPAARTSVITPGVDTLRFAPVADRSAARNRFALPLDRRIVLSVSRIDAYKGHDLVLAALVRMPIESRKALHYVVAGRGAHLAALKILTDTLELQDYVTWLGFIDDGELPALYGCADLFVLCTREDLEARGVEGFGMAFLEAQAAGVPVIGTRAGGIADAVEHDHGGWLIEPGDVTALSAHLERLAGDDPSFKAQGLRARDRTLQKGSWHHYVTALLDILDAQHG